MNPGIDHPIIAVQNMTAARATFERLGFTVTPRGRHREWGTGNWCIMFDRDYLELRGFIESDGARDASHARDLNRFLSRREGLMGVAFGSADAEASRNALVARGIRCQPLKQLTRDFELPEGVAHPRFSLCFLDEGEAPGLMSVVFCQHRTAELLRRPEWLRHANGALGVRELVGVVPDLAAAAESHARLFGEQSVSHDGDRVRIELGARQSITLMSPDAAQLEWPEVADLAAGEHGGLLFVTVEVADLAAAKRYFASQSIASRQTAAGKLRISPEDACGAPLEFVDRG